MDKNKCNSCGKPKCSCKNKEFTKAVIEIDNPEQITLMRRVTIPASMGDDTTVPPVVGKYHNVLLYYEANHKSYLYSSDGIPTLLANGLTDYEQAVNLPEINGVTLFGNKNGEDLGLQNKLVAGDGVDIDSDNTISISDIEQYAHFFDTVADMKAADLADGDFARTGGFHTLNDKGGALYKITNTGTANEMDVIAIGSTLFANLIQPAETTPEMFGAYGDDTHDDKDSIQTAITNSNVVNFKTSATYNVSTALTLHSNLKLIGNGCKIRGTAGSIWLFSGNNLDNLDIGGFDVGSVQRSCRIMDTTRLKYHDMVISTTEWGMSLERVEDFVVENITFNQVRTTSYSNKDGVHINGGKHGVIRNIVGTTDDDMIALNAAEHGLNYVGGPIIDIDISHVVTRNAQDHGGSNSTYRGVRISCTDHDIDKIRIHDCDISTDYQECVYMSYLEGYDTGILGDITIENCCFTKNHNRATSIINAEKTYKSLTIKNCKFIYKGSGAGSMISEKTYAGTCKNLTIENVEMIGEQTSNDAGTILLKNGKDNIVMRNVQITIPADYRKGIITVDGSLYKNITIDNCNINSGYYFIRVRSSATVNNLKVNNINEDSGADAFIEINAQCKNIMVNNCTSTATNAIEITEDQTATTTISANNFTSIGHIRSLNVGSHTANIRILNGIITNFEPLIAQVGDRFIYTTSSNYSTGTCTPKIYSNSGWRSFTIS